MFPDRPEHIKVPFPPEAYLSGVQRNQETNMWYRRSFTIPDSWEGEKVLLHFGAVAHQSAVYINGHLATTHKGSWEAFETDIILWRLYIHVRDLADGMVGTCCARSYIQDLVITPDLGRSIVKVRAEVHGAPGQIRIL